MLSRRHLRIRVMQALYAYYQSDPKDVRRTEQELLNGTEKIYDLYLILLVFLTEISHQEDVYYADSPASLLTGLKKSAAFQIKDLTFLQWLENNNTFREQVKKRKISWQQDLDTVKKAFHHLKQKEEYIAFISKSSHSLLEQTAFLKWLLNEFFTSTDFIPHLLEEKNIYWAESFELASSLVYRTIEPLKTGSGYELLPLYKDADDDIRFMQDLVIKTIRDDSYFQELIAQKTKNWDAERIALVDIILMKMALCEILNLSNIPVKVSINEYIDISKDYSTPNSKAFINGVIDKLVIELKHQGKIHKTGRGLVE